MEFFYYWVTISPMKTNNVHLSYQVPYYAQIASPELATPIFVEGMNPVLDPRWAESGASSPEEYAYWVERACGIACVKMCVEALGGPRRAMMEWIAAGLERNGYLIKEKEDGQKVEVGWIHRSLAELISSQGFRAQPATATLMEIIKHLQQDRMVIASVSYEVGDLIPVTKKGGHLVVVTGADCTDEEAAAFYLNNPSGRRGELQAGACIPAERFAEGYTGRVIVVEK